MLKALCLALHLCSSLSGSGYAIDGDTVVVEGFHVRLAGLDAEELKEPNGLAAKYAMMRFINGPVTCKLTGNKSYNRYVGSCFVAGNDLAAMMVAQGYALDCARYSGGKYRHLEPAGIRQKLIQKSYCS